MNKLLLIFATIIFAQLNSQINNRFVYKLKFVRDTISKNILTNTILLDVNDKEVKFYYNELYEMDSTQKATKKYNSSATYQYSLLLKRKTNSFDNENYVFVDSDYYIYKTIDTIKWNILPETKILNNYTLQKATTNFGGRSWNAWFSKDIPINEGPYKFQGLPGLILQIEDEKKHYSFNLIEIKKLDKEYDTSNIIDSNFGRKAIPISLEKYNQIILNSYNNPHSEMRMRMQRGENNTFAAYGTIIKNTQDLDRVKKIIQETKKRNNNPIELDKAIQYPE